MDAPLPILDRWIAAAALASARALRELRRRGPDEVADPLRAERRVSTRSLVLELEERSADPLAKAAAAWVRELTLRRVLFADEARLAAAFLAETVEDDALEPKRASPRFARDRVLDAEPAALRRRWAGALARGAGRVAEAARIRAERFGEAARQLGVADLDALRLPCDEPDALVRAASRLLDETAAVAPRREPWDEALAAGLVRGAREGWPAKLGARWLHELFRGTGLLDGLAIDLGELPRALGAASFARALAQFGGAWADADVPRSAPFVMARPPLDLRRARREALFGSLVADPVFCARALGLGRGAARDQARETARGLLVTLRLDAARILARDVLTAPERDRAALFEAATERALGAPIPVALAGVVPRLGRADGLRLAGALLAATDRRRLVERFDEDWFRSPHAAHALREEQAVLPAATRATTAEIEQGVRDLAAALAAFES